MLLQFVKKISAENRQFFIMLTGAQFDVFNDVVLPNNIIN